MPAPSSNRYITVTVHVLGLAGPTHESPAGRSAVLSRLAAQTICATDAIPNAWHESKTARGLVVVAVDDGAGSTEALRWAFDEAVMRGGELEVIQAISPDASHTEMSNQQSNLSELLADWRTDFPGLAVRIDATRGDPTELLIEAAADATVVVTRDPLISGLSSPSLSHDRHRDRVLLAV